MRNRRCPYLQRGSLAEHLAYDPALKVGAYKALYEVDVFVKNRALHVLLLHPLEHLGADWSQASWSASNRGFGLRKRAEFM